MKEKKKCSKCGIEKELCEFYFRKDRGCYYSCCKKCVSIKSKINWEKQKMIDPEYDKKRYEIRKQKNTNGFKKYSKKWNDNNKEYYQKYKKKNEEKIKEYSKIYYINNREKINKYTNEWRKEKNKKDLLFKLINNMRSSTNRMIGSKKNKTFEYLGCSPQELKLFLENKFLNGMSWDNYGKFGWHIDHIIPLSSAKDGEELIKLFHYSNLQPLWWQDNLKKGSKILT
jgi:hypothetical protein